MPFLYYKLKYIMNFKRHGERESHEKFRKVKVDDRQRTKTP